MRFSFTTPVYFDPDELPGGAAAVVEPAAVEAVPAVEPAVVDPAAVVEPGTAVEPAPVDWNARVTEWGGEDTVSSAVELQRALQTREGVQALFHEAGRALGLGDERIAALFEQQVATAANGEKLPSVEELLSDPERILTASEVARILDSRDQQSQQQAQVQQQAQAIASAIDRTFTDLKVSDESDRAVILSLADRLLPSNVQATPQVAEQALRKAHEQFQSVVQKQAEAIVTGRHELHEDLPTPLPAGGSGGGEPPTEPKTVQEAKAIVRKSLGLA